MSNLFSDCLELDYMSSYLQNEDSVHKEMVYHENEGISIVVLRPEQFDECRSSRMPTLSQRDLTNSAAEEGVLRHLHPVVLGRHRFKGKCHQKFLRMDKEGGTSLGMVPVRRFLDGVPTLGQHIGMKAVKFKPYPLKVLSKEMKNWVIAQKLQRSYEYASSYLGSTNAFDPLGDLEDKCNTDKYVLTDVERKEEKQAVNIDFNQLRSLNELVIDQL